MLDISLEGGTVERQKFKNHRPHNWCDFHMGKTTVCFKVYWNICIYQNLINFAWDKWSWTWLSWLCYNWLYYIHHLRKTVQNTVLSEISYSEKCFQSCSPINVIYELNELKWTYAHVLVTKGYFKNLFWVVVAFTRLLLNLFMCTLPFSVNTTGMSVVVVKKSVDSWNMFLLFCQNLLWAPKLWCTQNRCSTVNVDLKYCLVRQ